MRKIFLNLLLVSAFLFSCAAWSEEKDERREPDKTVEYEEGSFMRSAGKYDRFSVYLISENRKSLESLSSDEISGTIRPKGNLVYANFHGEGGQERSLREFKKEVRKRGSDSFFKLCRSYGEVIFEKLGQRAVAFGKTKRPLVTVVFAVPDGGGVSLSQFSSTGTTYDLEEKGGCRGKSIQDCSQEDACGTPGRITIARGSPFGHKRISKYTPLEMGKCGKGATTGCWCNQPSNIPPRGSKGRRKVSKASLEAYKKEAAEAPESDFGPDQTRDSVTDAIQSAIDAAP